MPSFNVGDIVAFQSNPYFNNNTNIILSGEATQISPLLIVIEVLKKKPTPRTQWEDIDENTFQYKCIWFSTKNDKFQENWFYHYQLKFINSVPDEDIQPYMLVNLKTLDNELGKTRSSLSTEENENKSSSVYTSLLSFLSPVMQVKDFVNADPQKKGDPNSGKNSSLLKSKQLVKCSWYNSSQDKFSEIILPIETLQLVPRVDLEFINKIKNIIAEKNKYFLYKKDSLESVIKPKSITSRSGRYYLRGFDYVENRMGEFAIWNGSFTIIDTPFKQSAPNFDHDTDSIKSAVKKEIVDLIKIAMQSSSYLRLQYKNRNDRVTIRTVSEYTFKEVKEGDEHVLFLSGYCTLRKEQRTFRIEKIQNIQELVLKFNP